MEILHLKPCFDHFANPNLKVKNHGVGLNRHSLKWITCKVRYNIFHSVNFYEFECWVQEILTQNLAVKFLLQYSSKWLLPMFWERFISSMDHLCFIFPGLCPTISYRPVSKVSTPLWTFLLIWLTCYLLYKFQMITGAPPIHFSRTHAPTPRFHKSFVVLLHKVYNRTP